MCDEGRLGYHYINSIERFTRPMARREGKLVPLAWPEIVAEIRDGFKKAAASQRPNRSSRCCRRS